MHQFITEQAPKGKILDGNHREGPVEKAEFHFLFCKYMRNIVNTACSLSQCVLPNLKKDNAFPQNLLPLS